MKSVEGIIAFNLHLKNSDLDLQERFREKMLVVGMQNQLYFSVPLTVSVEERVLEILDSLTNK